MKIFKGFWQDGACLVTVSIPIKKVGDVLEEKILDPQNKLMNHSPTGFQWGYAGSGPAQLSLALCVAVVGKDRALRIYQHYKFKVIVGLERGKDWELWEDEILKTIEMLESEKEAFSGE